MTWTRTLPVRQATSRQGLPVVLVAIAVATLSACGRPQTVATPPSPTATIIATPSRPSPSTTWTASTWTTTTVPRPVGGPGPKSGTVLSRVGNSGLGELSVENGTSRDAVITLARDGSRTVRVYVRSGETAEVRKIADGVYTLYSTTGVGWDGGQKAFVSGVRAQRFDDTFEYTTTSRQSTAWSVTLQAVPGGTASASDVDAALVPG